MTNFTFRRGDICWLEDEPHQPGMTYVLHGRRPCIIISGDEINRHSLTLIVAPITHTIDKRIYAGQFDIMFNGSVSRVRCDQIRVVDRAQLSTPVGSLSRRLMDRLDAVLTETLGTEPEGTVAVEV